MIDFYQTADQWLQEQLQRGQTAPFAIVATLTPELAAMALDRNPDNRNPNKNHIKALAEDIQSDQWRLNGETIIFSKEGLLNDGQNRCRAVIAANLPIETFMVFGINRKERLTTDRGASRTVGHYLQMEGKSWSNQVAAASKLIWTYENFGEFLRSGRGSVVSKSVLLDHAIKIGDELRECLVAINHGDSRQLCNSTSLAAIYFLCRRKDSQLAEWFFEKLLTGADLSATDPIMLLRRRLFRERQSNPHFLIPERLIINAWNNVRRGAQPTKIVLPEKFPKIE